MCQLCTKVGTTTSSGNFLVDGISYGNYWKSDITYSFTQSADDYGYKYEASNNYSPVTDGQASCALFALERSYGSAANDGFSVEGFTRAKISEGLTTDATIRFGQSDTPATAYAYLPGKYEQAGDIWIGRNYDYTSPEAGNYAWHSLLHEIGHSLGLKHGHESQNGFKALPAAYDSLEYSIMTYRSYVGADIGGYTYAQWSAPQTFMMIDIAALQKLYGADYTTNSGDTVYAWNPDSGDTIVDGEVGVSAGGTTIFATIWDGGGKDTYDLSAYSTELTIDLRAGQSSTFGTSQLADLGDGYSAGGNIYNALLYRKDQRSLVENAVGGSNSDTLQGNVVNNLLQGASGNDILFGAAGNDRLHGDLGDDVIDGGKGKDHIFGGLGNDLMRGGRDADVFHFVSGFGLDVIEDFRDGVDRLDLGDLGIAPGQFVAMAVQIGDDVVVAIDAENQLTLRDFDLSDLGRSDFV